MSFFFQISNISYFQRKNSNDNEFKVIFPTLRVNDLTTVIVINQ